MASRPKFSNHESAENASHLVGRLEASGTAYLRKVSKDDELSSRLNLSSRHEAGVEYSDGNLPDELEGLTPASTSTSDGGETSGNGSNIATKRVNGRPKSIHVQLERTDKAGEWTLNTDDRELRTLLKQGFERDKAGDMQKKRSIFSDNVLKKQFTAFDRQRQGAGLPSFHGFFTLFWMGMALMLVRLAAINWRIHGSIFGKNEIVRLMLSRDLVLLGLVDCVMMLSTLVSLLLQKLVVQDYMTWSRSGWILQSIWQALFLGSMIACAQYREWPWTHSFFITLHAIVMLMKQHSYAFYNGYLSQAYKRHEVLNQKLKALEDPEVLRPSSPTGPSTTSLFDAADLDQLARRRQSTATLDVQAPIEEDIASIAAAIDTDAPLSFAQVRSLRKLINFEIKSCAEELKGTCKDTQNYYPKNLNLRDSLAYIPLPTVVYELEYPRQEKINWAYVVEKTGATFGVIGVMIVVSEHFIYPIVQDINAMKANHVPLEDRLREFPWAFSDLLFPFMLEYLLAWYVIWECVLNVLAELTCFADRGFYADWWNSESWDQFARDWNTPVHQFLLRFAYRSSITSYKFSRGTATLVTFFLSACVHELVMAVIFGKIRGYLLIMQMLQLPLVMLSRTKFMRGKAVFGNLVFWLGIFIGPSFLCSLYLFL